MYFFIRCMYGLLLIGALVFSTGCGTVNPDGSVTFHHATQAFLEGLGGGGAARSTVYCSHYSTRGTYSSTCTTY